MKLMYSESVVCRVHGRRTTIAGIMRLLKINRVHFLRSEIYVLIEPFVIVSGEYCRRQVLREKKSRVREFEIPFSNNENTNVLQLFTFVSSVHIL